MDIRQWGADKVKFDIYMLIYYYYWYNYMFNFITKLFRSWLSSVTAHSAKQSNNSVEARFWLNGKAQGDLRTVTDEKSEFGW